MTPERWAQIRRIFEGAVDRPEKDRAAYLRVVCASDQELRREVESLLDSHDSSTGFLAKPVADLGHTLLYHDDATAEYPAGYRAGPYQLEKRIGRGGMGSVWLASRADRPGDSSKVAVKLVKRGMDTHEILRRFRLEREVLSRLDHPNIARLIDGGSTPDGLPYLAMEYVEGKPIDQFLESRTATITDRLKLFRQVCSAVQYAHQNLVVHRDIKTGNILVTADGVPKLLDFGIAKLLRTDLSTLEMAQTRPELRPMTLDYASPEQVRGEPITTSTDVYSLGVLLYKLLTTKMPYGVRAKTPDEIRRAIVETEPRRPSAVILTDDEIAIPQATMKIEIAEEETRAKARKRLKKKLAGDLDMIILKALRKEPQRRYASVEQFSEDINRYLTGRPVIARADTIGYRFKKFVQRNAIAVTAGAAIGLILFASTIMLARRERIDQERYERTTTALQKQLIQANLEIGGADRIHQAYDLAQSLLRAHPDQIAERKDVAHAALLMATLSSDSNEAAKYYSEALGHLDAVSRAEPQDLDTQRALLTASSKIGDIEFQRGNLLPALTNFSRALTIADQLSATDPSFGKTAVAEANLKVGEVLVRNGARDEGIAKLRKALSIYRDSGDITRAAQLEKSLEEVRPQ